MQDINTYLSALTAQGTISVMAVEVIEALKRSARIRGIDFSTQRTNRALGIVAALASAAGIHAGFDANAGTLTITGLNIESITHLLSDGAGAFAAQQVYFHLRRIGSKLPDLKTPIQQEKP